jgi:serine/threonine protein kinase
VPQDSCNQDTFPSDGAGNKTFDGRYRLLSELGRGGAGIVYKAEHIQLKRIVALKVCSFKAGSDEASQRFQRECQVLSKLQHPNIVQTYSWGMSDEVPYVAMELVQGESLSELLQREGKLSVQRCLAIAEQICAALEHAHSLGLVHRDIKPSNIMVFKDAGGKELVKVLDFGLAKFVNSELRITKTSAIVGTPVYMAPEQFLSESIDERTDVYALACTIYHALCGKTAHCGESPFELFDAHSNSYIEPMPQEIPAHIRDAVMRAMSRDQEFRPPTTAQFMSELRGTTAVPLTSGRVAAVPRRAHGSFKLSSGQMIAVAMVAACLVAGVLFYRTAIAPPERSPLQEIADLKIELANVAEAEGEQSPKLVPIYHQLIELEKNNNRETESRDYYDKAWKIDELQLNRELSDHHYQAAIKIVLKHLPIAEHVHKKYSQTVCERLNDLGEYALKDDDFENAKKYLEIAQERLRKVPDGPMLHANNFALLSKLAVKMKQLPEAIAYSKQALKKAENIRDSSDSFERKGGPVWLWRKQFELGLLYSYTGDYENAAKTFGQCVTDATEITDAESPDRIADARIMQGFCLTIMRKEGAEALVNAGLKDSHSFRIYGLASLAYLRMREQRFAEAVKLLDECRANSESGEETKQAEYVIALVQNQIPRQYWNLKSLPDKR